MVLRWRGLTARSLPLGVAHALAQSLMLSLARPVSLALSLALATSASFAQEATPLPGIVVETYAPPPPIRNRSARDAGPAAQARKPSTPQRQSVAAATPASPATQRPADSGAAGADSGEPTTLEVTTPNRTSEDIGRTASAVTVIGATEIERARGGGASVADVLKASAGVDVRSAGGIGSTVEVQIRGADSDQTLVMIDGVRMNDPASTGSEFDFSVLSLSNVARIEILRGPQSGVYGGDAIGGVINIVTLQGGGRPSSFAEIEGGSFGTLSQRAGSTGSVGRFDYGIGLSNFKTDGFSRLAAGTETDGAEKQSAAATFGYRFSDDTGLSARLGYYRVRADLDINSSGNRDDEVTRELFDGALTGRTKLFDGFVAARATLFANESRRDFKECQNADCSRDITSEFRGRRAGMELQSDIALGPLGTLTIGGRIERISGASDDVAAPAGTRTPRYDITENQKAAFAGLIMTPTDAFTLSAAIRTDDFDNGIVEPTYRFAAAYRFEEAGTKLRASLGTGAKAPTIQQRFENASLFGGGLKVSGNPNLRVETSRGWDVGIDQSLFGGNVEVSATYFENDIEDLIDFTSSGATGSFVNISSARISGVELAASFSVFAWLRLRGTYTNLDAQNLVLNEPLDRRPDHVGKATVEFQPSDRLYMSLTAIAQSDHFGRSSRSSSGGSRTRNLTDGFTRLDANAEFNLTDSATIFLRAENITDNVYQETLGFNTPERSVYTGLRMRF